MVTVEGDAGRLAVARATVAQRRSNAKRRPGSDGAIILSFASDRLSYLSGRIVISNRGLIRVILPANGKSALLVIVEEA